MIQRPLNNLLFRPRYRQFAERLSFHASVEPAVVPRLQCERFNAVWAEARRRYSFYRRWQQAHGLPDRIADIEELASFPLLRRGDLGDNAPDIHRESEPCSFTRTGGSTGQPIEIPVSAGDRDIWYVNALMGRSWNGVPLRHPVVKIWGHAHLLGDGLSRHLQAIRKRAVDYAGLVERFSAYTLDEEAMANIAATVAKRRPVIYAYPSAMRRFLNYLEASGQEGQLAIEAVILAAEVTLESDRRRIREILGAPTVIEYGMAEMGPVGFSTPDDGRINMLWDTVYCHAAGPAGELCLTTLAPYRFPYINYAPGDLVEDVGPGARGPFSCRRITGRTADLLVLTRRDGTTFAAPGISMMDAADEIAEIDTYVIRQVGKTITFEVKLRKPRDLETIRMEILGLIDKVLPGLEHSNFQVAHLASEPQQTLAGKHHYVRRETCAG